MDDDAGRLVDDEQIVVLVQHVDRRVFRDHRGGLGRVAGGDRDRQGNDVAERRARGGPPDRPAVHGDVPVLDPSLHARAAGRPDIGQVPPKHQVEAPAGVAAIGRQDARDRFHRSAGSYDPDKFGMDGRLPVMSSA